MISFPIDTHRFGILACSPPMEMVLLLCMQLWGFEVAETATMQFHSHLMKQQHLLSWVILHIRTVATSAKTSTGYTAPVQGPTLHRCVSSNKNDELCIYDISGDTQSTQYQCWWYLTRILPNSITCRKAYNIYVCTLHGIIQYCITNHPLLSWHSFQWRCLLQLNSLHLMSQSS